LWGWSGGGGWLCFDTESLRGAQILCSLRPYRGRQWTGWIKG